MFRNRMKRFTYLSVIFILSLVFVAGLSTLALGQGVAYPDATSSSENFVKVPGTFPIVEVTVTGTDALDALYAGGFDIIGFDFDGDDFILTIMVHGDELDYFADNNIYYEVVDDGTGRLGGTNYQGVAAKYASDGQPIAGIPENPNAGPTTNAPYAQPNLTTDPDAVFDPTGVLFNEKWGFPVRLGYRTVTEYYAEMNYLAATYPELVKKHVYGTSFEGVPLVALEISNNPGGNDGRPATLHMAGNHAREQPSDEHCMNTAWYLITQYGKDAEVTTLLDTTACWFLPVTNPDGNLYDMQIGMGTYRGNRNLTYIGSGTQNNTNSAVDLNRNYAYGWGSLNGSVANAGGSTYRGPEPFSEPETAAISEVYRSNMVLSSISGHTSGQLILYPWAFFLNNTGTMSGTTHTPGDDMKVNITESVTLNDLGRRLDQYNLHSGQYTNVMYAYSGESLDYFFGALRTLPFLFEYGRNFAPKYMGTNQYTATTPYKDAYGNQREFLVTYATAANSAGAGAPAQDLTAEVVFINEPYTVGYGSGDFGTVAQVEALGNLTGKILVSHRASANNDNAAIALAAQAKGAVGVLFCGASAYPHDGGYSHWTPNLGSGTVAGVNNPSEITIPVAGTSKPYVRELCEQAQANGSILLTLKSTTKPDIESNLWQFERQIGAYMENMSFATEFASHITGTITDRRGNLIPEATLTLEKKVYSPLIEGMPSTAQVLDRITESSVLEQTQTAVYEVKGGVYDWSVTPSQQIDNPIPGGTEFEDPGYTITVSAPGKKTFVIEGVRIDEYQMTVPLYIVMEDVEPAGEATAGINAPLEIFIGGGAQAGDGKLDYTVYLANADKMKGAIISATFDQNSLDYMGYDINLPDSYQVYVPTSDPYNEETGQFNLEFLIAAQNLTYSVTNATPIMTIHFTAKEGVASGTEIEGKLDPAGVQLYVRNENGNFTELNPIIDKDSAVTKLSDSKLKYDINGNGVFNRADIAEIVDKYIFCSKGEPSWLYAYRYDVNGDNIIDLLDIPLLYSML